MIDVTNLIKEFGSGDKAEKVLDNVTCMVPNNAITGLFGRKKSGKTIALRIITGVQSFTSGRVVIDGKEINVDQQEAKKLFGYVPDSREQFQGLTGEQYLNFVADVYGVGKEERGQFIREYVHLLNVEKELENRMSDYSDGLYKKIMLMGALIYNPRNLILDNIFSSIDKKDAPVVRDILKKYSREGNAVLLSGSELSAAEGLCDRVIVLVKGQLKYEGSLGALKEKYPGITNLEEIDMKLNEELEKLKEKDETVPVLRLWGGR
ncbi:MAG: ABC transporter ATP-binding protein [Lachnospiraceae bacterium]|nr:ABC transporter ATP-binding protein [Lachnospiraceae bacterium]